MDSITVFYLAFVSSVSFIRRLDLGACVTAFYSSRSDFVANAGRLLKFMLAAITSLPAATMSTGNKIPSNIPLASTLRISPLRARLPSRASLQLRFGVERFESSYRFPLSLYASSRESSLNFRGTFPPPRLILFQACFFPLPPFFPTRISVATRRRRNTPPSMLDCHGVTIRRERSTLVAHFLAFKWLGI